MTSSTDCKRADLPGHCLKIDLKSVNDARGGLVAIEGNRDIPFAVRRVYYLHSFAEGAERGFHAHKALRQLVVCVNGSCNMLLDDGVQREEVRLRRPDEGLLIGSLVWREMREFTPDCVLLVLASHVYDESDYIRSYVEFTRMVGNMSGRRHDPVS